MAQVISAEHVSPRCIKVVFDDEMRVDSSLIDTAQYSVAAGAVTITSIIVPTAHDQPYVAPNPSGGAPLWVYLMLGSNPYLAGNPVNILVNTLGLGPKDYQGLNLTSGTTTCATVTPTEVTYWSDPGLRVAEALEDELPKLGRAKWGAAQPWNYGTALAMSKLADITSGGNLAKLATAIAGPIETGYSGTYLGSGGFSMPEVPIPGVGDTFQLTLNGIPQHAEKLWGPSNGVNALFRTSIPYHSHGATIIIASESTESAVSGVLDTDQWLAPDSGKDRLLRLLTAPPTGATVWAVYYPRQSLLRIDREIIAYHESDLSTMTCTIAGRAQLSSALGNHVIGAFVEDVWATSTVGRTSYNLHVFGASGRPLEYLGRDSGVPKDENPSMSDTEFRRAIFNTAVTMRATNPTAVLAIRYIYHDLWKYVLVGEDPRWPGHLTIWYSTDAIGRQWDTWPAVEPWETWLDNLSYIDGFPLTGYYDTYLRNPIGDPPHYGDFYLTDHTEDPELAPFPIVLSGPDIGLIGTPAPYLPDPASVSADYLNYIVRPYGLERALPVGTGVLLLDFAWAT
jgi:hypothetical protein